MEFIDLNNLAPVEQEMLQICKKLGGQTSSKELIVLFRAAYSIPNEANILEIGSYRGRSAAAIGCAIHNSEKKLFCVDLWRDYDIQADNPRSADFYHNLEDESDLAVYEDFLRNTNIFANTIISIRGKISDFSNIFSDNSFGMVFIDGAHDYENTSFDIEFAMKVLKSGGIICGHDYHSESMGVVKAVDEKIINNPMINASSIVPETSIWFALKK